MSLPLMCGCLEGVTRVSAHCEWTRKCGVPGYPGKGHGRTLISNKFSMGMLREFHVIFEGKMEI